MSSRAYPCTLPVCSEQRERGRGMSPLNAPPYILEDVEVLERVPLAGRLAAGSTHVLLQEAVEDISRPPACSLLPLLDQPQPGRELTTRTFLGKKEDRTLSEMFDVLP